MKAIKEFFIEVNKGDHKKLCCKGSRWLGRIIRSNQTTNKWVISSSDPFSSNIRPFTAVFVKVDNKLSVKIFRGMPDIWNYEPILHEHTDVSPTGALVDWYESIVKKKGKSFNQKFILNVTNKLFETNDFGPYTEMHQNHVETKEEFLYRFLANICHLKKECGNCNESKCTYCQSKAYTKIPDNSNIYKYGILTTVDTLDMYLLAKA